MHIFTYGTLMFPEVWRAVAGREFPSIAGSVREFAAYRVRDAVYPGIVASGVRETVRGVLYFDVSEAAVARLDRFEDDFYVRQTLAIACDDGVKRQADAFIVPAKHRDVLTDEPWTRESFIAGGGLEEFVSRFAGFRRIGEEAEQ
jgi:gamma-glutamylcyclotransferase (GGCT)/AIG2-like uncharacterized protein YtfP